MSLSIRPIPEMTLAEIQQEIKNQIDSSYKNAVDLHNIFLKTVEVSNAIKNISEKQDLNTNSFIDHKNKKIPTKDFLVKMADSLRIINYLIRNEKNNLSAMQRDLTKFQTVDMPLAISKIKQIVQGLVENLEILTKTLIVQQNVVTKIKNDALAAQKKLAPTSGFNNSRPII